MAVAGLVIGIVSLVLAWWGYTSIIALPLAIVGLVLSCIARKKQPCGMATAGMVLGIIAVVLTGITFVTCGLCAICATCTAAGL